jgi:hypothetical protein
MKHAAMSFRVARLLFAVVVPALVVAPRRAQADGAFPDSLGPLLPSDRPNDIIVATNFGVVVSQDAGQTWTYSCEVMSNGSGAALYQMGPAPRDRLFAATDIALIYSDDRACVWNKSQGMLAAKGPPDYFADPVNQDRVWAVRPPDTTAGSVFTIVESVDGGVTFGAVRFTAAAGDIINGVELARSTPSTAYVTLRSGPTFLPKLAVTTNGGAMWTTHDLSPMFGTATVRLITIDPADANKVMLRVSSTVRTDAGTSLTTDAVALTVNGGTSFVTPSPLSVPGGVLTSFVRLPSGTILIGGVSGVADAIFRSTNGGTSFTELPAPTVRGLAQRNGRVYVTTDKVNSADGFSLGVSTDEGTTFTAVMSYDQIQAISSCAKAACQDDCMLKASLGFWGDSVCSASPMPLPVGDGGVTDGGAAPHDAATGSDAHAGTGGAAGGTGGVAGGGNGGTGGTTKSGGGCAVGAGGANSPEGAVALLGVVIALAALVTRRRG